ncbi:flagellar basal body rod protein, partial [Mariprofundus erugo]
MKVDANMQAMQNIGTMQQVSANNLANVSSDGFRAS